MPTEQTAEQGNQQPITDEFQSTFAGLTTASDKGEVTPPVDANTPAVPPQDSAADNAPAPDAGTPATPPVDDNNPPQPPVEPEPDYKALFEQEQQKVRSWNGRLSAADRKIKELEEQLKKVQTQEPPPSAAGASTPQDLVDLDDPVIKAFIAEMGDDFVKPLDLYMQKKFDRILKPIMDKLSLLDKIPTIEQQVTATAEEKAASHYEAIVKAHSDVGKLLESKVFDAYIESLPYKEAIECKRILDSGTTQEVIDFITEYKTKTKPVTPQPKPPLPSSDINAATAVKHTSSFIPKGQADVNDFMGAFQEAASK